MATKAGVGPGATHVEEDVHVDCKDDFDDAVRVDVDPDALWDDESNVYPQ